MEAGIRVNTLMARLADHTGLFVPRRPADVARRMLRRKKSAGPRKREQLRYFDPDGRYRCRDL